MSKVKIIVLALVSLMLANALASGQGRSVKEGAAEHGIELGQSAQASHDPSVGRQIKLDPRRQ